MPVNELRVVREQVEAALRQVTAQLLATPDAQTLSDATRAYLAAMLETELQEFIRSAVRLVQFTADVTAPPSAAE